MFTGTAVQGRAAGSGFDFKAFTGHLPVQSGGGQHGGETPTDVELEVLPFRYPFRVGSGLA